MPAYPVLGRMQGYINCWEQTGDRRRVFLTCYSMMTANMLTALEDGEFHDREWVNKLLHHFADYYFAALEAYEHDSSQSPSVWQAAFGCAQSDQLQTIQHLLLGVNAHINYDLVLALADLLGPEWESLSPQQRALRYADHCQVNHIIGRTIDSVQDQVIERYNPLMQIVDRLMGPLDEWLISRLITAWRDRVWQHALDRITAPLAERETLQEKVEASCLDIADSILLDEGSLNSKRFR